LNLKIFRLNNFINARLNIRNMKNKIIKVILSSLVFTVLLTILSFVINILILGEAHEKYDFLRPDDDLRIKPGLFITSFIWSILISLSYTYFGSIIKIKN